MKFTYFLMVLFFSLESFAGLTTYKYCRELLLTNGERGDAYYKAIKEVNEMAAKANSSKSFVKDQFIGADKTLKFGDTVNISWKGGRANMSINAKITNFCTVLSDDYCVGVSVKMVNPEHERYNGIEINHITRAEQEKCWPLNLLEPMK